MIGPSASGRWHSRPFLPKPILQGPLKHLLDLALRDPVPVEVRLTGHRADVEPQPHPRSAPEAGPRSKISVATWIDGGPVSGTRMERPSSLRTSAARELRQGIPDRGILVVNQ